MKVALHVDQLRAAAPGGIGTYVRELSTALAADDDAPGLVRFTSRWDGPAPAELGDVVEIPATIRTLYPRWALTGRPPLPAALRACDVVHATNHAAVPPAAEGQGLVVTVHDLAFDRFPHAFPAAWRWLYRTALRAAIRRADVLLVPSRATHDDLRGHGAPEERIRVTPLAASLPASDADVDVDGVLARLGVERPYVVSAGTIEPRKNQVRLIRAYRQVAPDVPHGLVLAGPDGWGVDEVGAEIARGGQGTIVRTGALAPADLDAVYRGADVVAYVSLYEGFGLPVLEAMRRGVAVLGSTTPAVAETAGDAALLVDPQDVAEIADGLARLLGEPGVRGALVEKGRIRADGFTWAATARATLEAYREAKDRARA